MKTQAVSQGRKFAQVVRGAAIVFLRDGFAGASVDDIARAAGVSKATLYSYFPDKTLMFQEAMKAEVARLDFRPDIDAAEGPQAGIPKIGRQVAEWLASPNQVDLYRIHAAEAPRFAPLAADFHDGVKAMLRDRIRPHLDRWDSQGLLCIDDADAAADQLVVLAGSGLREGVLLGRSRIVTGAAVQAAATTAASLFLRAYSPRPPHAAWRRATPR